MTRLVLASQSEWREKLLSWTGLEFGVMPSGFDESLVKFVTPQKYVVDLARNKAQMVWDQLSGDQVVVGADTVVWFENKILGKPKNRKYAKEMLASYRGKDQRVLTGVAVIGTDGEVRVDWAETKVSFGNFSDEQLEEYLDGGEWQGKAGAYMVLGGAKQLVEKVEGSVSNVVGLPMKMTVGMLGVAGIGPEEGWRELVRSELGFED